MAARSPTNLNTSRNRALAIGVDAAKLAPPDLSGFPDNKTVSVDATAATSALSPVVPCSVKL